MIEKRNNLDKLIEQGDIYKNIVLYRNITTDGNDIIIEKVEFDNVVVLSQTCDLERIYDKDPNSVLSVLVAPLFLLEEFKNGNYLNFVNIKTDEVKSEKALRPYRNREKPRFYLIELGDEIKLSNSFLNSFIIDFKYFFTVDMKHFTKERYVASIKPFYREDFSHNFASYLSRIGIPIN